MYLKSVTMQGFKSFANKTKIELDESITAIVGPNGSGKSNITDAITWVLGETSVKNLRGSKMEDVIFSGTDNKKPLGMAQVTIVFDNSDRTLDTPYNEVSVTRRMYRSLESEFLINNKKCRLKDIKELFMDTGIGKDGYSLIGQGKIESVLSSRPEDRRAIFEEAAGISKFKYKKVQSKNKLLKTEENLIRIEDLLTEISNQEESLNKQAEKAKKYLEDFNRLKDIDINFVSQKISILNEDIDKLSTSIDNLEVEYNNLEIRKSSLVDKKNNIELLSVENKETLSNKKTKLEEKSSIFEELKVKSSVLDEQLKSLKRDIERLNTEKLEQTKNIESNENTLLDLRNKAEEFDKESANLQSRLNNLDETISLKAEEIATIEKNESKKNSSRNTLKNDIENIKFRNTTLQAMIEDKKNRKSSIDNNIVKFENNKIEFKELINELSEEKSKLIDNKTRIKTEVTELESAILNFKKFCQNENSKLNELDNSINEKNAKLKILKNMESNFEGYNRSVKTFMNFCKNRNLFNDSLYGPVGDKFKVLEEYEKAITVALGSMAQNIIVRDTTQTQKMLKILNDNKMGRITFLPLDRVKSRKTSKIINDKGAIGVASDLIEFDDKFRDVFENLLGYVLIADNYKNGAYISRKYNIKVVTLLGEVFNTSGAITGGSLNTFNTSFIQRKNEIEEYIKELKNLSLIKKGVEETLKSKMTEFKLKEENLINLKDKYNSILSRIEIVENNLLKNNQSNEINEDYLSRYLNEKSQIENSIHEDIKTLKDNELLLEEKILKLKDIDSSTDKDDNFINIKNEFEKIKSQRLDIILLQKENKERISYNNLELERFQNSIEDLKNEIQNLDEQLMVNDKLLDKKISIYEESLTSSDALANEISTIKKDISEIEDIIFQNDEELNTHKEEIVTINENILNNKNERENQKYKIEVKEEIINTQKNRIFEEYNISEEDLLNLSEIEEVPEKVVKTLRRRVKNYGEVNIGSIDEHKLVKERLNFYSKQRDDLIEAKNEIENILNKLDSEMKKSFKDAIKEISDHFQNIFKILFNGGNAEINIEGDLLESGIEIKASPPGKKLQSLSLLSGGERALTAVALLFALLKVRPASFCILDEIDAALDDANIKRYAEYLMTLENIQFIIITHRKLTMEIAKSMYGVTMQEKGISTMYSVKLND